MRLTFHIICLFVFCGGSAFAQTAATDTRPGIAPDIRKDETSLKLQRGDYVVVPVPISNPTLESGLVVGGAYFYRQTEQQKKNQPASLTGVGAMYTSNDSKAAVLVQQNYWREDRWRFTGAVGAADLRLSLLTADLPGGRQSLGWRIDGAFLFAKLARRLRGDWYGGLLTRMVNANQRFDIAPVATEEIQSFDTGSDIYSVGVGLYGEFDTRDNPFNSTSGRYFKLDALFNDEELGSNKTYQSFSSAFRSYHRLSESLVLAWEVQACHRGGKTPLWDACTLKLRGFSATDYLGKTSASTQAEARWQWSERWGMAGFAGAGYVGDSSNGIREHEPIPSYGAGLRFTVLKSKRINLRLDYARSDNSDAIHFTVGEAF